MPDVTIKNVPVGAEERVINMAMVAIERHLRSKKEVFIQGMGEAFNFVDQAEIDAYKKSVDDILIANGLEKKFEAKQIDV